ncbi:hypothetical protein SAMN04244572_04680 [Azotobacter beijerinckii]|uniref:Uncharacterized protein n=1 Tax=Azotobacter beijerinckii TaxID=170623 RepID=A0A1H7A8U9_9GAMM|nr:hypothetical protein [Azotobacter beijerinckii]SEJ62093.1 hypothetical protein SAMN04244572_04680 [Azotobacter beijerinckii]
MLVLPRKVQLVREKRGNEELEQAQPLADFRDTPAWVLLGEPGAGKSTALKEEAQATGGQYLSVSELIASEPLPEDWRGRTLYIDALDEVRATDGVLERIRSRLRSLGSPPFRLACRAADWYGPSDRETLQRQSPDGQLATLQLYPLSPEDIQQLLRDKHGVDDPQAFIEQAERHGVAPLLENPQTLELLAKAIRGSDWPASRDETYRLACKKLVQEANKKHRDLQRQHPQPASDEDRLQAAGQLCAVLLLSGKRGIALDQDAADEGFPPLERFAPQDMQAARRALHSKLFLPAPGHEECLIPSHRSIAEYLAADWLARALDGKTLPLQRLLALLLGADGGVVSDLRGLYAWLALHSLGARARLIEADPLSVILYGDARPMSVEDKRRLLNGLQEQARRFAGFRWRLAHTLHPFGALADDALVEDFRKVLLAPERDEASQSHVDCVLDILEYGGASPQLGDVLLEVIEDASRWLRVRAGALGTWLNICCPEDAIALLNRISQGQVADDDDGLAGNLLRHLYPANLGAEELLQHLYLPKDPRLVGSNYTLFWDYELHELAPADHLPILLDGLVNQSELFERDREQRRFFHLADNLLVRGLQMHGDTIADERLFDWLGVGADKYGHIEREKESQQQIGEWLSQRPERYKAILRSCIQAISLDLDRRSYQSYGRLHGAQSPNDIGLWHLLQAEESEQAAAQIHLVSAVQALADQRGAAGLSLERLEDWSAQNPDKAACLDELLKCPLEDWRLEDASRRSEYKKEQTTRRRQRTTDFIPHLEAISSGTARPGILDHLANVWQGRFSDIPGETLAERFASHSDLGNELILAAESGFKQCPLRADLPSVDEIVALSLEKKRSYFCQPCLLGMELHWRQDPAEVRTLPEDVLRRMLAFHFTYPTNETPEWFVWLVRERPALTAEVLATYASATLKAGQSSVSSLYQLEHDKHYGAVAEIAVPQLLKAFPLRAKKEQLNTLKYLLKAALHRAPQALPELIDNKLALKSLDSAQRVYWHATALLLDSQCREAAVWDHIGKSAARANLLADFLGEDFGGQPRDGSLPPKTLGKLIELIVPHAELERMSGWVSDAMQRGNQVRAMINRLGGSASPEAAQELERLLGLGTLTKLKHHLENARHDQQVRQREEGFRFQSIEDVARILANHEPTSIVDLAALTLDLLDEIAHRIRHDNDDGFKAFWNIRKGQEREKREENLCRDALLTRMRLRLDALGIGIEPEADHHNDKRADLCLNYRNHYALPIEIKRDNNDELWTALRKQLIGQYAGAPKSGGHGIYLVIWFDGKGMPPTTDGGKKPTSPGELRARLEAQLTPEERQRIHVRVLDVSWAVP